MSFTLSGVVLSEINLEVKDNNGQSIAQDAGWSFTVSGGSTTIRIDDYHLNQATIAIKDASGYWPATLNVIIGQDQDFVVGDVVNGIIKLFLIIYSISQSSKYS